MEIEPIPEQLEELDEETLTEIEALSEQLALHSIESEARHEQILEGEGRIEECLQRLEQLSTQTENPVNQAMVTEITTLKTELAEVKGMLTAMMATLAALSQLTREPSPNPLPEPNPETIPEAENPAEHVPERSTEEQGPGAPQRKHRIL